MEKIPDNINLVKYLEDLSSSSSSPGGGSAAALAGAIASSLVIMVSGITNKKKKLPDGLYNTSYNKLKNIRDDFLDLCCKDALVYSEFKKNADPDKANFLLKKAIDVPLEIFNNCQTLNEIIKELIDYIQGDLLSDMISAVGFNKIAFMTSKSNIALNAKGIKDFNISKVSNKAGVILNEFKDLKEKLNNKS